MPRADGGASRAPRKSEPPTTPPAPPVNKSRSMHVVVSPGESADRATAGMVARGLVTNASTVIRFESNEHEGLSLMDMAHELRAQGEAVNGGDLSTLERTLTAQALSLNAIFGELARIAHCNLFKVPEVADRYLRLALKAQSQSRATVETLAAIKNPPVVFARQANINNGGQQQVNNGPGSNGTPASARPGETISKQNELLEDHTHGSPTMDTRAKAAAGRTNQGLEPVGAFDRPAKR